MIKHIVMWNIKEGLNKAQTILELKQKLESMPKDIPFLKKVELGINYNGNKTARDIVLYTEFESKEDLENYIVHPTHKKVGEFVRSVVCDRVDVDYEI